MVAINTLIKLTFALLFIGIGLVFIAECIYLAIELWKNK